MVILEALDVLQHIEILFFNLVVNLRLEKLYHFEGVSHHLGLFPDLLVLLLLSLVTAEVPCVERVGYQHALESLLVICVNKVSP